MLTDRFLTVCRIVQETGCKREMNLVKDGGEACLPVVRQSSISTPPQLCTPLTSHILSDPIFLPFSFMAQARSARVILQKPKGKYEDL